MNTLYAKIAPYLRHYFAEQGKVTFICFALVDAYCFNHLGEPEYEELKKRVEERLAGEPTVTIWLAQREGKPEEHYREPEQFKRVQRLRHRWLKHLCEEYERENPVPKD